MDDLQQSGPEGEPATVIRPEIAMPEDTERIRATPVMTGPDGRKQDMVRVAGRPEAVAPVQADEIFDTGEVRDHVRELPIAGPDRAEEIRQEAARRQVAATEDRSDLADVHRIPDVANAKEVPAEPVDAITDQQERRLREQDASRAAFIGKGPLSLLRRGYLELGGKVKDRRPY